MCKNDNHRPGKTTQNQQAHESEHNLWSRRDFLTRAGLLGAGSMLLGNSTVGAFQPSPFLAGLTAGGGSDRILVLLRFDGGNDGLNMVVPFTDPKYYAIRPTIGQLPADIWQLSQTHAMPNVMNALQPLWQNGQMKVVHNVGYPNPNYSHFRSADIWATGSGEDQYWRDGWIGRFMENEYPAFLDAPPVVPPALQIGVSTNLIFRSETAAMALAVSSPEEFYQLAQTGQLYQTATLGNLPHEVELKYVRQTANAAFRYAETIKKAWSAGKNQANYPSNSYLAEQMSIVARLIKGQLGTRIYMVTIGGFDTHANQLGGHPDLLNQIANSAAAFYQDLAAANLQNEVLTMSFSEFGRTIYENASLGTDHGTGGPMLLFGPGLNQGFVGTPPDLNQLDPFADPDYSVDFRDVYATILTDWLGTDPGFVDFTLGAAHPRINGLVPAIPPQIGANGDCVLHGYNPSATEPGTIEIKYSMMRGGNVRLQITDAAGHVLRTLVSDFQERGSHTFKFKPANYFLANGNYVCRLQTGGQIFSRSMNW